MINYSFSYQDLEYFLLIFVRVTSFIFIAPFFSMSNTPRNIRVVLSFFISLLLYYILPQTVVEYETILGYTVIVLKEAVAGLLIGFAANICTTIVAFAGHIADMEMGLSMASMFDPTTKENTTITGIYYNYMVTLILILTGMHRYLLQALAQSFELIPINGLAIHTDAMLASFVRFMGDYIIIGFRICLPIFAVMLLLNAVLGILAKVSPQLNMFAVGMQIKVLVGLVILFVTTAMLPGAANFIFTQMKQTIVAFVQAMQL